MKKNTKRLIVLTFSLLILFFLIFTKNQLTDYFAAKSNYPFSKIDKNLVSEIDIVNESNSIQAIKIGQDWWIKGKQNLPADQSRLNNLLDTMIGLKIGDVVSTNIDKQKQLGIDKQKIIIKQGKNSYELFLGNSSGTSGNFIKIAQDNKIYVAQGFDSVFAPDDYRNLTIDLISDPNKVTSIEISSSQIITKLEKKGNDWIITDNKALKDRVDYYMNSLKTLSANDILSQDTKSPSLPSFSIRINENNLSKTIDFYSIDKDNYLAKLSTSDYIFKISSLYVDSLNKTEKDFMQ